jgi:hypothetical protein
MRKKFRDYKRTAKFRSISFDLDLEEFRALTAGHCYYCGRPPSFFCRTAGGECLWNGIDRVDNALGYLIENVVTCCAACNLAKRDMPQREFFELVRRIATHQGYIPSLVS